MSKVTSPSELAAYLERYLERYDARSRFLFTAASIMVLAGLFFLRLIPTLNSSNGVPFLIGTGAVIFILIGIFAEKITRKIIDSARPKIARKSPGIHAFAGWVRIFRHKGISAEQKFHGLSAFLAMAVGLTAALYGLIHSSGLTFALLILAAMYYAARTLGYGFLLFGKRLLRRVGIFVRDLIQSLIFTLRNQGVSIPDLKSYSDWFGEIERAPSAESTAEQQEDVFSVWDVVLYHRGIETEATKKHPKIARGFAVYLTLQQKISQILPWFAWLSLAFFWYQTYAHVIMTTPYLTVGFALIVFFTIAAFLVFFHLLVSLLADKSRKLFEELVPQVYSGEVSQLEAMVLLDIIEDCPPTVYQPSSLQELLDLASFEALMAIPIMDFKRDSGTSE
ncbi:MAG: hypothetical protein KY455_05095 [Euryarchaeota archaeon]|nr:hypothetical protein [Euryarchaeota archaeon]